MPDDAITRDTLAAMEPEDRFLGARITPITRRRIENFRRNRRGFWSLWLFLALFFISLFAEFVANDKPLLVRYDGQFYMPVFTEYAETAFGGEFMTEADYRDEFVIKLIEGKGWMVWPLIPFSFDTVNYDLPVPAPGHILTEFAPGLPKLGMTQDSAAAAQ